MRKTMIFTTMFAIMSMAIVCAASEKGHPTAQNKEKPPVQEPVKTPTGEGKVSWNSARLAAVEKLSKDKPLDEILKKQFTKKELHELAASCASMPIPEEDRSDFADILLKSMVHVFSLSGDREGLVTLLSNRCPPWVGWRDNIEWFLALRNKELKDPILILGEAYSNCKVSEVRKVIATAVRRGFVGLGVKGKDDAEFVRNAMQWYSQNKDHLEVNMEYGRNFGGVPMPDNLTYEKRPLFTIKPSKDGPKELDGDKSRLQKERDGGGKAEEGVVWNFREKNNDCPI